jgi:hypothetical protein
MRSIDLTGNTFGSLTALRFTKRNPKNGMAYWECKCKCGSIKEYTLGNLRSGHTQTCGCDSFKKGTDNKNFLHGFTTKDKCYKAWCKMKERCYNPLDNSFENYGAKGITVSAVFKEDFLAFYKEVGDAPSVKHSIERIDNTKGYIEGNIKWATRTQQSQNKAKYKNNSSGICGIGFEVSISGTTYVVARWAENGPKHKKFNCTTLGLTKAYKEAILYRRLKIESLNNKGAEYSINHGESK